jgi:hypothetical protein
MERLSNQMEAISQWEKVSYIAERPVSQPIKKGLG